MCSHRRGAGAVVYSRRTTAVSPGWFQYPGHQLQPGYADFADFSGRKHTRALVGVVDANRDIGKRHANRSELVRVPAPD